MPEQLSMPGFRRDLAPEFITGETTDVYMPGVHEMAPYRPEDILAMDIPIAVEGGLTADGQYVLFSEGNDHVLADHRAKVEAAYNDVEA